MRRRQRRRRNLARKGDKRGSGRGHEGGATEREEKTQTQTTRRDPLVGSEVGIENGDTAAHWGALVRQRQDPRPSWSSPQKLGRVGALPEGGVKVGASLVPRAPPLPLRPPKSIDAKWRCCKAELKQTSTQIASGRDASSRDRLDAHISSDLAGRQRIMIVVLTLPRPQD